MKILTLTSDFGWKDFYLSSFKGLILKRLSDVSIIDISHNTEPFMVPPAAYNLKNSWQTFPKNTLHVFRVGESTQREGRYLAFSHHQHFFIVPDNGVITLLFSELPDKIIALQKEEKSKSKSVFLANAITHILKNDSVDDLGETTTHFQESITQQPILSSDYIRGVVQQIDRYGNVITNISQPLFDGQLDDRDFEIVSRSVTFHRITTNYSDVSPGEKLALFNAAGFLQISIHQGNASKLFGLSQGDTIQIDFL